MQVGDARLFIYGQNDRLRPAVETSRRKAISSKSVFRQKRTSETKTKNSQKSRKIKASQNHQTKHPHHHRRPRPGQRGSETTTEEDPTISISRGYPRLASSVRKPPPGRLELGSVSRLRTSCLGVSVRKHKRRNKTINAIDHRRNKTAKIKQHKSNNIAQKSEKSSKTKSIR